MARDVGIAVSGGGRGAAGEGVHGEGDISGTRQAESDMILMGYRRGSGRGREGQGWVAAVVVGRAVSVRDVGRVRRHVVGPGARRGFIRR